MDTCPVCEKIDRNKSHVENAKKIGVSEATIRRHRKGHSTPRVQDKPKGTIDLTPDGAHVKDVVVEGDLEGDWSKVFAMFNLDASKFEVVDDTVRMSTWQQSKALEDGSRDVVQLYSYSARFRRVREIEEVDVSDLLRQMRGSRKPRAKKEQGLARVVIISDLQAGKVDAKGGTKELLERYSYLMGELEEEMKRVKCDEAVILDPGDIIEGIDNTASQAHTNDISVVEQVRTARGVVMETVLRVSALHEKTRVATVPSNHAAHRRGKDYLGKPSDDWGIDLFRAVEMAFDMAGREDVEFLYPETDWEESLALEVKGATVGLVHGHRSRPDKIPEWWAKQALGDGPVARATILASGHYHSLRVQPSGTLNGKDRYWFQAPTMDNGSSWYRNIEGESGEAGLLTFTIDDEGDWDNLKLIRAKNDRLK